MKQERGFTLLEVCVVSAMLVLLVGVVFTSTRTVTSTMSEDDIVAKSMEQLQRSAVRIAQIARPCSLVTYRMISTPWDVANLYATAVGEWVEPVDGQARSAIRFQSADGQLSVNAAALTSPRTFRLVLDDGELPNGVDDDGDGMIDEGEVMLDYDGSSVVMANNVETCNFTLDVRTLAVELRSATRRRDGSLQHFTIREHIYLRNN